MVGSAETAEAFLCQDRQDDNRDTVQTQGGGVSGCVCVSALIVFWSPWALQQPSCFEWKLTGF